VFSTLIALRDDLNSGNSSAVSARIGDIDQAMQLVLSARGSIGAKVNRLSTQKNSLEDMKTNVTGLLSRIQDVDMVEAATEFATQQNIYKAALAAGAKAIQPSLLDFLR
jgi:flagellar hook-associated protein 3 FlgL